MANWNSGFVFNRKANEQGFVWNSSEYIIILRLNDVFAMKDNLSEILARLVLSEKDLKVYDELLQAVLFDKIYEEVISDDQSSVSLLVSVAEDLGIKDEITDLVVLAFLRENFDLIEDFKTLADLLIDDRVNIADLSSIEAFLDFMDSFGLNDLRQKIEVLIESHDSFGMTDHDPRQAVSDFMIGAIDDDDRAYDWLIPFGLKVDWRNTKIQVMPEAELTTVEIPGADGSIVEDTVYKDRLFTIVAFSEDGLTKIQKEDLKSRLTQILDATKHQTKKLTVQARGTSFDVKYDGQAEITSGPSYVKASIPLHTPPYGYELFSRELYGSGLIHNEGDAPCGPVIEISGPISNPSFMLGTITYTWSGTIPFGHSLTINFDKMTCFTTDQYGKKSNALANLTGEFQKIDAGKSMVLTANPQTESHIHVAWTNPVLW